MPGCFLTDTCTATNTPHERVHMYFHLLWCSKELSHTTYAMSVNLPIRSLAPSLMHVYFRYINVAN